MNIPMSNDEKEILKEKIKRAIKISSQKLIEKKRAAAIYISINPFKVNFKHHDKPVLTY